jgi:hypothetical protein
MGVDAGPEPVGPGVGMELRRSVISNFAAMSGSDSEGLSRTEEDTSEIIDRISDAGYAFLDVYVGIGISFPLWFVAVT